MTLRETLIIAHRGASGSAPENTLLAFEKAADAGADGIELDVLLTKDEKIVVFHDDNTLRLTGHDLNVREASFAQLRVLNLGKNQKIPLLADVLNVSLDRFSIINIEIKSTGLRTNGIERHLTRLIERFRCHEKILVSSFNPFNLKRFKRLSPRVRVGYLMGFAQDILVRNRWVVQWLNPHTLNLEANLFFTPSGRRFFAKNRPQWIWTVNNVEDMCFWIGNGAQAIITDYPERLAEILKNK